MPMSGASALGVSVSGIRRLQLLLLLSAMLTGLTGLIGGDRLVDARQVERSAVAAAAVEAGSVATAIAEEAASALAGAERLVAPALVYSALTEIPPRSTTPVDERRLE